MTDELAEVAREYRATLDRLNELRRRLGELRAQRVALSCDPITRPDGLDPDGFYQHIGTIYARLIGETHAPAKTMATASNVPVSSVHRWIREARRRGFIAQTRKGRVA